MRRPDCRRVLAALLSSLGMTTAVGAAAAIELGELMALQQQRRSGEARFTEQRFVSGLDQTLRFAGTLSFTAPDRLVRRTLTPRPESFVVEGNQLTLERGGRSRTMALDAQPELAAMVDAMRGTLAGNAASLQQHFAITVAGSRAQWSLTLEPLAYRLLAVVKRVRIEGRFGEPHTIEILLADGDRSVMTIEPAPGGATTGAGASAAPGAPASSPAAPARTPTP